MGYSDIYMFLSLVCFRRLHSILHHVRHPWNCTSDYINNSVKIIRQFL